MKKLKKKMLADSEERNLKNSLFPNYTKTALETTSNILNLIFSLTFKNNIESNLLNQALLDNRKKKIILILDEIEGRDAEDIIKTLDKNNRSFFFYRCSYNTQQRKSFNNFNIFHKILSMKKKEKTKISYKIGSCSINGIINNSLYEKFENFILNPEELKMNNFPDLKKNPNFLDTSTWSGIEKNIIALDCEMVETTKGIELARISLVNENFDVIYDYLVTPENNIINYYTHINGLEENLFKTNPTKTINEVIEDLKKYINASTILVGHSLENDFFSIGIVHNRIVDTSVIFPKNDGFKFSLKTLAYHYLKMKIQEGAHDSREDAKISLAVAKIGIEILPFFKNNNTDEDPYYYFRHYVKNNKVAIFDFDSNIKAYLKFGIFQEPINETVDVLEHTEKYIEKWKDIKEYIILSKINMNSFGNAEKKKDMLLQFIVNNNSLPPDHLFLICTIGHFNKINTNFGYDFLMLN